MHLEIQVALNFVISYLYNKLPRRRVNIFGEELEKALKDKFQGHWYPEKPFKGSAFRCLKTGEPIDTVLERAARESGVSINDILENLPNELSVWIDPGEVSYRIGEKGSVTILYSEPNDNHDDNTLADGEVHKTFNPEAQCFRPIDTVNTSMNNLSLSLSPKTSYAGSSPHSASSNSPSYKGSPNPMTTAIAATAMASMAGPTCGGGGGGGPFMQQRGPAAPLTFTTATFAQTKFGSTKLKTSSKRTNSSSYRMSPTEFSNYIKQRAMQQQQIHHGSGPQQQNHFGPIGPVSPARSLSPNPALPMQSADSFYFQAMANMGNGMYSQFNNHRNIFDTTTQYQHSSEGNGAAASIYGSVGGGAGSGAQNKFNSYLDPNTFYGFPNSMQQQSTSQLGSPVGKSHPLNQQLQGKNTIDLADKIMENQNDDAKSATSVTVTLSNDTDGSSCCSSISIESQQKPVLPMNGLTTPASSSNAVATAASVAAAAAASSAAVAVAAAATSNTQDSGSSASSLMDGLNSFYSNATATGSYQQLLVAN